MLKGVYFPLYIDLQATTAAFGSNTLSHLKFSNVKCWVHVMERIGQSCKSTFKIFSVPLIFFVKLAGTCVGVIVKQSQLISRHLECETYVMCNKYNCSTISTKYSIIVPYITWKITKLDLLTVSCFQLFVEFYEIKQFVSTKKPVFEIWVFLVRICKCIFHLCCCTKSSDSQVKKHVHAY